MFIYTQRHSSWSWRVLDWCVGPMLSVQGHRRVWGSQGWAWNTWDRCEGLLVGVAGLRWVWRTWDWCEGLYLSVEGLRWVWRALGECGGSGMGLTLWFRASAQEDTQNYPYCPGSLWADGFCRQFLFFQTVLHPWKRVYRISWGIFI